MYDCTICDKRGHTALYCPQAVDERKIRARLAKVTSPSVSAFTIRPGEAWWQPLTPTVRRVDEEPLEAVVARQVGALTKDLNGWQGGEELPRPPADLTTYADAFASAARNCTHEDVNNISYGRQWLCADCGRYLDRKAMREARGDSYWWSW